MTFRVLGRAFAVAALMLGALVLAGCGESSQEKATAQVCAARSDISKQAKMLSELTVSTSLLSEGKAGLEAIGKDLTKIKEAQPNLAPARKEQIQAATDTFQTQVTSIVTGLVSNPSLSNAEKQIKSSLTQFASSFEHALAPINCS
jgi:hypothetical protein